MALKQNNIKTCIVTLLQSTTTAYTRLANGILALGQLSKASELLDTVICSLKEGHGKYDDLIKVLSGLAMQYKKLDVETKSHIRTVKEQAQINTKIIEKAKQLLLQGNDISSYFVEIESTVKESLTSSEEHRKKYDVIIYRVKDCCSQAKAGYVRNEHKADLAEKGASVGLLGGMGFGGTFAAFQVGTKALCVFGLPGAVAGGALGLIGGCVVGGMACGLPFATAEAMFRKYAEKFKMLDETLSQIDEVLLENFVVLTEICRLLSKLKKVAQNLSSLPEPNMAGTKDDGSSKMKPLVVSNHKTCSDSTDTPVNDDANIDFLIGLKFDSFKGVSEELEKNCDYLLDDMAFKMLGFLSLDEESSAGTTDTEKKKLN